MSEKVLGFKEKDFKKEIGKPYYPDFYVVDESKLVPVILKEVYDVTCQNYDNQIAGLLEKLNEKKPFVSLEWLFTVLNEAKDKMPERHDKAICNQVIGYVKGSLSAKKEACKEAKE